MLWADYYDLALPDYKHVTQNNAVIVSHTFFLVIYFFLQTYNLLKLLQNPTIV